MRIKRIVCILIINGRIASRFRRGFDKHGQTPDLTDVQDKPFLDINHDTSIKSFDTLDISYLFKPEHTVVSVLWEGKTMRSNATLLYPTGSAFGKLAKCTLRYSAKDNHPDFRVVTASFKLTKCFVNRHRRLAPVGDTSKLSQVSYQYKVFLEVQRISFDVEVIESIFLEACIVRYEAYINGMIESKVESPL